MSQALLPIRTSTSLRHYQEKAVADILDGFRSYDSQLVVMATGLGKTVVFAELAARWEGSVLVLAHRDELVQQNMAALERATGEYVEVEKADSVSSKKTRVVVGSVQSMNQRRLERLGADRFSLVIADEAHHYLASTYKRALEFFRAKRLGVTATPDRADERALGAIFDNVPVCLDILDGIEDGYLVPLMGRSVNIEQIDLAGVGTYCGDLAEGELDEAVFKGIGGIVSEFLRLEPSIPPTIAFFPGVHSAECAAELFNARSPGSAEFICGATPQEDRRRIIRDFREGKFKILCNCQIATEGFDAPNASVILLARPTTSRALYAQMVGRGTRVLPGVVDGIMGADKAQARRTAIAISKKPNATIIDFCGNAGRHSLVCLEDILGGDFSDEELSLAKKKKQRTGEVVDPMEQLEAARAAMKRSAEAVARAKVLSTVAHFDPFAAVGANPSKENRYAERFGSKPASDKQKNLLIKLKVKPDEAANMSAHAASKLIDALIGRINAKMASLGQLRSLSRWGINDPSISFERANKALDYIASTAWGKNARVDPEVLKSKLYG